MTGPSVRRALSYGTVLVAIVIAVSASAMFVQADPDGRVFVLAHPDGLTPEDPLDFVLWFEAASAEMDGNPGRVLILEDRDLSDDGLYRIVAEAIGREAFVTEAEAMEGGHPVFVSFTPPGAPGTLTDPDFLDRVVSSMGGDQRWAGLAGVLGGIADAHRAFESRMAAMLAYQDSRATDPRHERTDDADPDFYVERDPPVESDDVPGYAVSPVPTVPDAHTQEGRDPTSLPVAARGTILRSVGPSPEFRTGAKPH